MKRFLRMSAALAVVAALLICAVPAFSVSAADYNAHDVQKLRAFFELTGNSPFSNGVGINGSNYDPDDPSTWRCCTWTDSGRLLTISFSDIGWSAVGTLDLSGCTALTTVRATDCYLTGADFSGCVSLRSLNLTGNYITSLSIDGCTELELLWFPTNRIGSVDISHCTKLTSFDCSDNGISQIDVSSCPLLTVLRCSNNELTSLDVSNCPLITDLRCKTNLITSLDLSNLTGLVKLFSFNNRLTSLDISVMNGGESFIIDAQPGGFIGTKCSITTNGAVIRASYNIEGEASFTGWYSGSELLTDGEEYVCVFNEGAKHLTAHFDSPEPTPGPTPEPTPVPTPGVLPGDANGDGYVTVADALLILRYSMNLIGEELVHLDAADTDGNGFVNVQDALWTLRRSMGLV